MCIGSFDACHIPTWYYLQIAARCELVWLSWHRHSTPGSLPPQYRMSDLRYRTSPSISKTSILYAHSILTRTFCTLDSNCYQRWLISKVSLFDIKGHQPPISNVNNRVTDIQVSWLQCRTNSLWYHDRMLIFYTILKVTLTSRYRRSCHTCRFRYLIQYSTQTISFTSEQKLPLPRLFHSCTEESQRHVPWIPAESCTLFLRKSTACPTEIWRGKVLP